ncbi:MAG: DUF5050 domain-containing protein [Lachnospiraceae bacterium]|nr:DUF5050 domain-containing protein [Lachnospiraceae bacterium]
MKKEIHFTGGIKPLCVLAAGLFLLSACGRSGQEEEQKQAGEGAVVVMETDTVDTDFGFQCVAESEKGYYIWGYSAVNPDRQISINMLLFKDKESGRIVPLCNRPDCAHVDEECNAYFPPTSSAMEGADGFLYDYIQYYDGSLYVSGMSVDRYVSLYRIEADGSGDWELSTKVFRTDYDWGSVFSYPEILIADGYVYFVDWNQKCQTLERIPLGGGTAEVLYDGPDGVSEDISATEITEVKNIEGFVYFLTISYLGDSAELVNSVGGLYQCDMETGQCVKAKDGYGGPWSVHNGYLYYGGMEGEGLCRYSMRDGSVEILSDDPINVPQIALTQDYIIICDQMAGRPPYGYSLIIYDYDGNRLATVPNNIWLNKFYGGNSEMLFGSWGDESGMGVCFLDLTLPFEELHWENFAVD